MMKAKLNFTLHLNVLLIQNEFQRRKQKKASKISFDKTSHNKYIQCQTSVKALHFTTKPDFAGKQLTSRQKSDF